MKRLKDANCRHGLDAYVLPRIMKMKIPSGYIVIGGLKRKRSRYVGYCMYVTCKDGSGERSSRGLSRHRGCRKPGLEGTCGLGGGRGGTLGEMEI